MHAGVEIARSRLQELVQRASMSRSHCPSEAFRRRRRKCGRCRSNAPVLICYLEYSSCGADALRRSAAVVRAETPARRVAFDGERDQTVDELGVRDPARLPELRVHADRREPGMVLISFMSSRPVAARGRSRRAPSPRVDGAERGRGEVGTCRDARARRPGSRARARRRRTCRVVVELVRGHDLADDRGLRLVVAEHPALELAPSMPRSTTTFRSRRPRSARAAASAAARLHLPHPTDEPRFAGFTKQRKPELVDAPCSSAASSRPRSRVLDQRQPGLREDRLHHRLVHPDRRGQHAGADVRESASSSRPWTVPSSP